MGRIRVKTVKRAGEQLFDRFKAEFNSDFQYNKSNIANYASISSKKLRNKIAGYITRLIRIEAARPKIEAAVEKEAEVEA